MLACVWLPFVGLKQQFCCASRSALQTMVHELVLTFPFGSACSFVPTGASCWQIKESLLPLSSFLPQKKKSHCPKLVLGCKISFFSWNYFRYCIVLVGCTNPFFCVFVTVDALAAKYWLKHFDINMSCQGICIKVPSNPNYSVILWSKPRWLCSVNLYLQNNSAAVCISRMC